MNPSCHHCGAPVEPGTLFCRHCGAPQIRVAIEPRETPDPAIAPPGGLEEDAVPEPERGPVLLKSAARRATILGGLLQGILAVFGLWFISIPLGALFSITIYRKRALKAQLNAALGARLGLISGAIGFVFFAVAGSLALLLSNGGERLREQVMKQLQQAAAQYPAQAQQALDYLKSAQGWSLFVAWYTIFMLIAFLLLSTISGAVGGAILSRKEPRRF